MGVVAGGDGGGGQRQQRSDNKGPAAGKSRVASDLEDMDEGLPDDFSLGLRIGAAVQQR